MSGAPSFDRIARLYRWAEYIALGPLLQRTRTHFLPQLIDCRNAVVLGDGDGRFLARLLLANPRLQATAVDTSARMLCLLKRRCHSTAGRLQTIHTDALTFQLPPGADLIVTHFFLDCFAQTEINALADNLAAHAQPDTLWLLSDFRIPTGPLSIFARLYIRALYFAFRLLTGLRTSHLPDPQRALASAGFHRIAGHRRLCGLLYTELWQLQRATIGSNASMADMNNSRPAPHLPTDPQSDPEPASPSLPEPDPGVYHHDPADRTELPQSEK